MSKKGLNNWNCLQPAKWFVATLDLTSQFKVGMDPTIFCQCLRHFFFKNLLWDSIAQAHDSFPWNVILKWQMEESQSQSCVFFILKPALKRRVMRTATGELFFFFWWAQRHPDLSLMHQESWDTHEIRCRAQNCDHYATECPPPQYALVKI